MKLRKSANEYSKFGGMTSGGIPELILQAPSTKGLQMIELRVFK